MTEGRYVSAWWHKLKEAARRQHVIILALSTGRALRRAKRYPIRNMTEMRLWHEWNRLRDRLDSIDGVDVEYDNYVRYKGEPLVKLDRRL